MEKDLDNRWDPVWFAGFYTKDEIDRIVNPQKPMDFLLRERADIVADNIQYERVYMNKARVSKRWSFEKSFNAYHYNAVLNKLIKDDKAECKGLTYGDMFSNDVNGYAWNDEKGGRFVSLMEIHKPIKYELQYIAGHEFAHHLCGHLDDNMIFMALVIWRHQIQNGVAEN